jgi:hypothetical protein
MKICSKPSCSQVGAVVLAYDYGRRTIQLEDPVGDVSPHHYLLCITCAERLTPPRGWTLEDRRVDTPLFLDEPERSPLDFDPEIEAPTRTVFFGSNL